MMNGDLRVAVFLTGVPPKFPLLGMTPGPAAKRILEGLTIHVAGKLNGAGVKVVTPNKIELSRLRARNIRLKQEDELQINQP